MPSNILSNLLSLYTNLFYNESHILSLGSVIKRSTRGQHDDADNGERGYKTFKERKSLKSNSDGPHYVQADDKGRKDTVAETAATKISQRPTTSVIRGIGQCRKAPVGDPHLLHIRVLGMGIALLGADNIIWWGGNINSGVVQVFLAWVIAPVLAGVAGALIFLVTKYGILLRKDLALKALFTIPFYFFLTTGLLTMLIVWKGGSSRIDLEGPEAVDRSPYPHDQSTTPSLIAGEAKTGSIL
ncbi:unnamed protein product [Penicillium viridicatum]